MDLKTWTSDQLTKLGGSDPTVVDFVLATASSCKSASQLHDKLSGFLDGSPADVSHFANELFHRRAGSSHPNKTTATTAATTTRRDSNGVEHDQRRVEKGGKKKYALLSMEEDDVESAPVQQQKQKQKQQHSRDRKKEERRKGETRSDKPHLRKDTKKIRVARGDFEDRWADQTDDEVDEEQIKSEEEKDDEFEDPLPKKRRKLANGSASPPYPHSDGGDSSLNSEQNRKEVREMEETLKDKDRSSSSAMPPKSEKETKDLAALRLKSRQDYLRKRETEKILLLRQQVEEEAQEERSNPHLTMRELVEFQKNREILATAEANLEARTNAEDQDGFYMPEIGEISKQETLTKRIRENEGVSDLQMWEEEQSKRAKATSSLRSQRVNEKDYEYVFDDSHKLQFVQGSTIAGTVKAKTQDQKILEQRIEAALAEKASIQETRKKLPMYSYRQQLVQAIRDHQCIIVSSDTGSGKTTQIPQYIIEENLNNGLMVGVTQPRRVAAMSVAARVADEQDVRLGTTVGYSVRFEQKISDKTLIKFMTDGLLLRELVADPTMTGYGVIMLDEAHERTLSTDILLAFLKDLSRHRTDLKIIISSATLNSAKFSAFLGDCPIFHVPGRMFPVETLFASAPEANYVSACVTTVWQIHLSQMIPGDILVFLTGQDDIELAATEIEETAKKLGNRAAQLVVAPIYSTMPSELQQKIFEPTPVGARKVILATNIAETSITVPGISYVIDSGLAKENVFNPATGTESLQATPISRASAEQRAGRAGRVGPGTCLRIYTKHDWLAEMPGEILPDMVKSNLSQMVLFLKAMGIENLIEFDFLDAPAPNSLIAALSSLYELGALATDGRITRLGRQMVEFPTDPELAAAVIASHKNGCVAEALTVVAMLGEASNLFFRPKEQKVHADSARSRLSSKEGGDHMSLLNIYNAWSDNDFSPIWAKDNFLQYRSLQRARLVREQLEQLCDRVDIPMSSVGAGDHVPVLKSLLAGYFSHTATLTRDGLHYRSLKSNMTVKIHPSSVLAGEGMRPKVVMYHEIVQTSADWMRQVAPIEAVWLGEVAPHFWKSGNVEKTLSGQGKKMPKGQGATGKQNL